MSSRFGFRPGLWAAALAFAGLLAGHWMSYMVVAPDAHARADLLRATGHGSQHHLLTTLGLAAAVAAVIAVIGGHLRRGWEAEGAGSSILRTAVPLWLLQTAGFVVLETMERVEGLHDVGALLQEPAFLLGLVAQGVVALVAAVAVFALRRTVDAIRRLLSLPKAGAENLSPLPAERPAFPSSVARAAWNLRGPPIAAGT